MTRIVTIDPDGPGPLGRTLVAAGAFDIAAGNPAPHVAMWNGATWIPMGSGIDKRIDSAATWDQDGPGLVPERLIIAGTAEFGDPLGLVVWTGADWIPFGNAGGVVPRGIKSVFSWDPDADGPQSAVLVAAGQFERAGIGTTNSIGAWDGTSWTFLGQDDVFANEFTVWDPDGVGPVEPELVGAGSIGVFPNNLNGLIRWNGATWERFTTQTSLVPKGVVAIDEDGDGPLPATLIARGAVAEPYELARWLGNAWQPFGDDGTTLFIEMAMVWDDDENPATPAALCVGGEYSTIDGAYANGIAMMRDGAWAPFGDGAAGIRVLTVWDRDGAGPDPAVVMAAGNFIQFGPTRFNGIAAWDGRTWATVGPASNAGTVNALIPWPSVTNPFGGNSLIAARGGEVLMWNGAAWSEFAPELTGRVDNFAEWDPDGPGPLAPNLVAVGDFFLPLFSSVRDIARFDGADWVAMPATFLGSASAVVAWDDDDDPDSPARLIIAGTRTAGPTNSRVGVFQWDGAQWIQLGAAFDAAVITLYVFDPDGPEGPAPSAVFAAGSFTASGALPLAHIAKWDGSEWTQPGAGFDGTARVLGSWDPDGPGPEPAALVAGGQFTASGPTPIHRLAMLQGTLWQPIGSGVDSDAVRALAVWPTDTDGASEDQLVVAGGFDRAGGIHSAGFARWTRERVPAIADGPDPVSIRSGADAEFTVELEPGSADATFQWYRDQTPLTDGPAFAPISNTRIEGARTDTLSIRHATTTSSGTYRCLVSTSCGSVTTLDAALTITRVLCPGDIDGEGSVDARDFNIFAVHFGASVTPNTNGDLTGDGVVNAADFNILASDFGCGAP